MAIKSLIIFIWIGCATCLGQNFVENSTDFNGIWVNKEYYDFLKTSKSPYLTQQNIPYKTIHFYELSENKCIKLYESEYGQTEVSSVQYYSYKDKQLSFLYQTFDGEFIGDTCKNNCLQFYISSDSLLVRVENGQKKLFVKINNHCMFKTIDCNIEKLINTLLLKGEYLVKDSNDQIIAHINIDENGEIIEKNTEVFSKYYRATLWFFYREIYGDYTFDAMRLCTSRQSNSKMLKMQRNGDTIQFWETHFDEETYEVSVGEFAFSFVRSN